MLAARGCRGAFTAVDTCGFPRATWRSLRCSAYATREPARAALKRLRPDWETRRPATVRDWLEQWLAGRTGLRASMRRNYRAHLDNPSVLGEVLLAELDTPVVSTGVRQRVATDTAAHCTARATPASRVKPQLNSHANMPPARRAAPGHPPKTRIQSQQQRRPLTQRVNGLTRHATYCSAPPGTRTPDPLIKSQLL